MDVANTGQRIDEAIARSCMPVVVVKNVGHQVSCSCSNMPAQRHRAMIWIVEELAIVMAQKVHSIAIGTNHGEIKLVPFEPHGFGVLVERSGWCRNGLVRLLMVGE